MPLLSLAPLTKVASADADQPEVLVLGIWISNTAVKTLLLRLKAGTVTLASESATREYTGLDQVVSVTDALLQDLGPISEGTNDVIFVVDQSWVVSGDISSDKKPYIKAITTQLGLSPIGFVEQSEAVTNFSIQNNPRFSGIFAFIEGKSISLTVVEHASITGSEVVGRSAEVSKDLVEGLARFAQPDDEKASYLPPQLFLLSLEENEVQLKEIQQRLLTEPLNQSAKFLQTPMISVVSQADFLARIVQEAGVAIADAKGLASAKQKATIPLKDQLRQVSDQTANVRPVSATELGFSEFEPNASQSVYQESENDLNETAVDDMPTSFGIPISKATTQHVAAPAVPAAPEPDSKSDVAASTEEKQPKRKVGMSFFENHQKNTKLFVGIGVGLGLLVLALTALFIVSFRSTAVIAISLATKVVTTEANIEVSADVTQTDVEKAVLAAERTTHTVSGKNSILTTGVKIVGENAKGTITIYNKTTADKDFPAGTTVKTGDRSYTLDQEVTAPAAKVTETTSGEKKDYGTVEVAVTATDIGAEGNISKDTELLVGSFADTTYSARAKSDFSGGSSREVRVVAESDKVEAVKEVQKELEEQAVAEVSENLTDGEYLLPGVKVLRRDVTYSSEVGDEVNEVTASVTLTVEFLKYTVESLRPLAASLLASQVEDGYVLSTSEPPSIMSQPVNTADASQSAMFIRANISSEVVPVLDLESLYQYVLGKKSADAAMNLKDHEGIADVDIQINPGVLSTIPNDKDRVQLRIVDTE